MPRALKLPRSVRRVLGVLRWPLLLLLYVVLLPVLVALGRAGYECRPWRPDPPAAVAATASGIALGVDTAELADYVRPEDQTYLTLPEWYIVYSAEEYAAHIAKQPPSSFPYFEATGQFWQSYYAMCRATRDQYAFNGEYHTVLAVIGASFTVENTLKGLYEHTVGWLVEQLSSDALSEEDAFAAEVAAEYGAFLHTIPWYQFPFGPRLQELWRDTPAWGPNPIRKAERRGALSIEYGTKALYASLIRAGTQSAFEAQELEIQMVVEGLSPALLAAEPELRLVRQLDENRALVAVPRYEAFTQLVPRLARDGLRFVEIAGNDTILITVLAPREWNSALPDSTARFAMPILTVPDRQRVAVEVPIVALDRVLREIAASDVTLEHIYDY